MIALPDNILFQRDRLIVTESRLTVGRRTVFYPNISAVSIGEGRPLLASAWMSAFGLIPVAFLTFMGARLMGPPFQVKAIALLCIPFAIYAVVGFLYRAKYLFVTIDGQATAVLKSKDITVLVQAKVMIEKARTARAARSD